MQIDFNECPKSFEKLKIKVLTETYGIINVI